SGTREQDSSFFWRFGDHEAPDTKDLNAPNQCPEHDSSGNPPLSGSLQVIIVSVVEQRLRVCGLILPESISIVVAPDAERMLGDHPESVSENAGTRFFDNDVAFVGFEALDNGVDSNPQGSDKKQTKQSEPERGSKSLVAVS